MRLLTIKEFCINFDPEFRKKLDPIHPELAPFMAKAMKAFAERELS